jgi:hypothetical protein
MYPDLAVMSASSGHVEVVACTILPPRTRSTSRPVTSTAAPVARPQAPLADHDLRIGDVVDEHVGNDGRPP